MLHRYWFRFSGELSRGLALGCGVTAFDRDDARRVLTERVFRDTPLPDIVEEIEDIDISTLDDRHVRPNMTVPLTRGVWFPLGFD